MVRVQLRSNNPPLALEAPPSRCLPPTVPLLPLLLSSPSPFAVLTMCVSLFSFSVLLLLLPFVAFASAWRRRCSPVLPLARLGCTLAGQRRSLTVGHSRSGKQEEDDVQVRGGAHTGED